MKLNFLAAIAIMFTLGSCNNAGGTKNLEESLADSTKIVSLNGTVSEVLVGLGLEKNIVGTDITSNYPESMKLKPKVGHNKNINAEGVMALQPNLIIGTQKEVSPALAAQLRSAGAKLILLDQEYTPQGTKNFIQALADSLHKEEKGHDIIKALEGDLAKVKANDGQVRKKKVLFIYARGTGTMMVGGTGTPVDKAIQLAGGTNAVKEFADYKPLTAEALVKANPDVILLFDTGLESLGGAKGLSKVQGIKETNAGKNNKIISMDGQLLTSFGPRLGIALQELGKKIK